MPPHMWLRFGMKPEHVVEHFSDDRQGIRASTSWCTSTRRGRVRVLASSSLAELARMPWVKVFKVGTRDMNKYARDLKAIREAAPEKAILTCHDEYLLASMVQGVDGALVGFASFIPDLIVALWRPCRPAT